MANLILFVVMYEKYTRVEIIHSITYLFSAARKTEENFEGPVVGFCGNFVLDQLPTMFQVTNAAFEKIKVKAPFAPHQQSDDQLGRY